jgi:hypothetical protein
VCALVTVIVRESVTAMVTATVTAMVTATNHPASTV